MWNIRINDVVYGYDIYPEDDYGRVKVLIDPNDELPKELKEQDYLLTIDPNYCYLTFDGRRLGRFKLDGQRCWYYEGEDGVSIHPGLTELPETEVICLKTILKREFHGKG